MGPWYDIAVHMHRDDLREADLRRNCPKAGGQTSWIASSTILGVLLVLVATL